MFKRKKLDNGPVPPGYIPTWALANRLGISTAKIHSLVKHKLLPTFNPTATTSYVPGNFVPTDEQLEEIEPKSCGPVRGERLASELPLMPLNSKVKLTSEQRADIDNVLRPRFERRMQELPMSAIEQERQETRLAVRMALAVSLAQAERTPEVAEPVQQPPDRFKVPEGFERIKAYATRHGVTGQYVKIRLREHIMKVHHGLSFIYVIKSDTPMPVKSGRGWWRRKTKD